MEINDRRLDDDKNPNSLLFANFTYNDNADPCQVVEFKKEENSKWSLKTGILPSAHPERVPTLLLNSYITEGNLIFLIL